MFNKIKLGSFFTDVISLSTSRFLVAGLGFLAGVILARLLGPSKQGIITTLLVVPSIVISFADLGMRQAATYYLGKQIYDDQSVISTVLLMSLFTSLLSIVIVFIFYNFAGYSKRYGITVLWIPIIYIPLQLFLHFGTGILMAKQRIYEIAIANALTEVIYISLLFPLFFMQSFQIEYTLSVLVAASTVSVIYIAKIIKRYGHLKPTFVPGLPWQFLKLGFVYAIALFVLGLHYRIDVMLLAGLSNVSEVGIYSVGVGVAEKLWLLPTALTMVIFARSSAAVDSHDYARKTAKILRIVLWVGLIPCIILYVLAPWLIPLIYGEAYQRSGMIVQAILPGVWATLIFKILYSDLAGRGRPDAALWVYGLALLINIGLNLWWIPFYGALGSAWASSVTYILGASIFAVVYARISRVSLADLFIPKKLDFQFSFREQN